MNKLDRKLEKYAIPNLSLVMSLIYGAGFLLEIVNPQLMSWFYLDPYRILHGQIWRLVTWILIPSYSINGGMDVFFCIISILFYYSIGKTLEQVWGNYVYNKYIFSGILFTVIGSFLLFGGTALFSYLTGGLVDISYASAQYSKLFSAYYIYMTIFLGFACTFPDNRVLLMFVIPVKMKWLGIAYSLYFIYQIVAYSYYGLTLNVVYFAMVVVILSSLMNFLVFFISMSIKRKGNPAYRAKQAKRHHEFKQSMKAANPGHGASKHKCAICGRTELDNAELQFRFCSKCNGNYEYCNDHLFNHKHVE